MNTGGSYNCHCNRGYRLHVGAGGRSCVGEHGVAGGGAGRGRGRGRGGAGGLSSLHVIPSPALHSPRAPFLPLRPERVRQAPPVRRRRLLHQLSGTLQVQLLPRLPAQSLPTSRVRRWGRPIRTDAGPQWCLGLGWGRRASLPSLPSPGPLGGFGLEPRGPASPGRSVTEGGPAEAPEHLAATLSPHESSSSLLRRHRRVPRP